MPLSKDISPQVLERLGVVSASVQESLGSLTYERERPLALIHDVVFRNGNIPSTVAEMIVIDHAVDDYEDIGAEVKKILESLKPGDRLEMVVWDNEGQLKSVLVDDIHDEHSEDEPMRLTIASVRESIEDILEQHFNGLLTLNDLPELTYEEKSSIRPHVDDELIAMVMG